eukprot:TRINITY_DN62418_c0_g1_i1.p1 TRINITY_DN62418_c0_g1~~TRINITY_DN62418_c0_g1_i1.p1  ORF type:complete len:941 (-),score=145.14 TRINITY_DN62418_c0_g1_i1:60-2882(-)
MGSCASTATSYASAVPEAVSGAADTTSMAPKTTTPGPAPPPGMRRGADITNAMRERQRREPQRWTMMLEQWSVVVDHCRSQPEYGRCMRQKGRLNMYDVCHIFVKPWTAGTGCSLAVLMSGKSASPAELMISHAWGEEVEECQSALAKFAKELNIDAKTPIWFCVFANYQPEDGVGPSIAEQLAMQPFRTVIESAHVKQGHGMCAVHTTAEDLYGRLWCVHEVDAALSERVEVRAAMSQKYIDQVTRRVELFVEMGCDEFSCMNAAGIRLNTCTAKCGHPRDERMLIDIVQQQEGGFERLDSVVEGFRRAVLPSAVVAQLRAVAALDSLKVACDSAKALVSEQIYTTDGLEEAIGAVAQAMVSCRQVEAQFKQRPKRFSDLMQLGESLVGMRQLYLMSAVNQVAQKSTELNHFPHKVCFTRAVDEALEKGAGLEGVFKQTEAMLKDIFQWLRGNERGSTRWGRLDIMTKVLTDEVATLQMLLSMEHDEQRKAMWDSQCRFYEDAHGCVECRCGGYSLPCGSSAMRQMLIPSDIIWQARAKLVQAVAEGKVFFAIGFAGSAGTQTIKNTFEYFGTPSIVVAFSPDASDDTYPSKYWESLCGSALAAWPPCPIILEEANLFPSEGLIAAIEVAGRYGIPLCFSLVAGRVGGREIPPEVLRSCLEFRFRTPDLQVLLYSMLSSRGFTSSNMLSQNLDACSKAFRERLSKQRQYDFSGRFWDTVIQRAEAEVWSGEDEIDCLVQALWAEFSGRLAKVDFESLRSIMTHHFGGKIQIPENLPDIADLVVNQLYNRSATLLVHSEAADVEMLIGKLRLSALSKSVEVEQVPGVMAQMSPSTFVVELAGLIRRVVAVKKIWVLVVVGREGSIELWKLFEPLHSMFARSRKLCVSDHEVLRLHRGISIILLLPRSAANRISPATLLHLGYVLVDDAADANTPAASISI